MRIALYARTRLDLAHDSRHQDKPVDLKILVMNAGRSAGRFVVRLAAAICTQLRRTPQAPAQD
jgi:hypothetical protein